MPPAAEIPVSRIPAVNVASVPQRSPLRYPGGKTWLIPHIRAWLEETRPDILIEPFAGGATASLTAVMDDRTRRRRCVMIEIDPDVAAFWRAALHKDNGPALVRRVRGFKPTREEICKLERRRPAADDLDRAFRALVRNRTRNSGIMAPGASLIRRGENGKGVASRWYPETLAARLNAVAACADRIDFREGDGLRLLETELKPILGVMAANLFHVGDAPGQGQAMKLLNNMLSGAAMAATTEAVAFGETCGLDLETMLAVLNVSTGRNTATSDKFPNRIAAGTFDAGFTIDLLSKDIDLFLAAADAAEAGAPVGAAVGDTLRAMKRAMPGADFTHIYTFHKNRAERGRKPRAPARAANRREP